MKLKIKKIFAREFLILLLVITTTLLAFLFTYPYNNYISNKIGKISESINSKTFLVDSLQKTIDNKSDRQNWLHSKLLEEYDVSDNPDYTKEKMWERLSDISKKDSIKIRWTTTWSIRSNNWKYFFNKIGFDNPDKLKKFIDINAFNETDSLNIEKIHRYRQENHDLTIDRNLYSNRILTPEEQKQIGVKTLTFLSILFFLLRYIIYGIKWSIKILKSGDE